MVKDRVVVYLEAVDGQSVRQGTMVAESCADVSQDVCGKVKQWKMRKFFHNSVKRLDNCRWKNVSVVDMLYGCAQRHRGYNKAGGTR